ncbi:MAG: ribosome silencing factor [gamma proteobacterium endosymbiont of Trioza apicalis]
MSNNKIMNYILKKINNNEGKNIKILNVKNKSNITNFIIICTGISNKHIMNIANNIIKKINLIGIKTKYITIENSIDWIVIDLNNIIIHIMLKETRKLYNIEQLWI